MPRYFIDLHDGANHVRDHEGSDFADLAAARAQAVRMMTRVAQGLSDPRERQDYVIAVRDAQGAIRLRLRLSYDIEYG